MQLPEDFIIGMRATMGNSLFSRFMQGMEQEAPVSIRLNPKKTVGMEPVDIAGKVPWCREGYYLSRRPTFTFDPLLHAGCYYVQEASSMFVTHVLRQFVSEPVVALDLCAAPGGKTTAALTALPSGSTLYANEPVRQRAQVLSENVEKWGVEDITVTNNYPVDYQRTGLMFDVVLADVPCSGEGMFRKDPKAIGEWSLQHTVYCQSLQRDIVSDIWPCLRPGGLLVYSTCTLNTHENEENVAWICRELGADVMAVETDSVWGITGSLLPGFDAPVYRFIPGVSCGEGLFMAVLRRNDGKPVSGMTSSRQVRHDTHQLNILSLSQREMQEGMTVNLSYADAISYLQRQVLRLPPETPRGLITVAFEGHPLGMVKNIGSRANNLYPQQWRIKTTHIPNQYEAILRYT